MKTNYFTQKLLLTCLLTGFLFQASAQTSISSLADFTAANVKIQDLTQIICAGKNVQLNVPASSGITYQWETRFPTDDGTGTGTPLAANNAGVLTDAGLTAGYYLYKLKATNTSTGCSEIYDQVVYVLPAPALAITAPSDVAACTNVAETFAFTSTLTNNTSNNLAFAVDYQWYTKKGTDAEEAISGATTKDYTVTTLTTEGAYQVYAKATYKIKACTPTESDKKTVTVSPTPTRPVITIASN